MPPLLWLALLALLGGLAGRMAAPAALAPLVVIAGAAGAILVFTRFRLVPASLLVLSAGAASGVVSHPVSERPSPVGPHTVAGPVSGPPVPLGRGCRVRLRGAVMRAVDRSSGGWRPLSGPLEIRQEGSCPRTSTGGWLVGRIFFTGGPSWRPRGGARVAFARKKALVPFSPGIQVPRQKGLVRRARQRIIQEVAPWRSSGRALVTALLTGDRSWVSSQDRGALRKSGTAHLLAISGLHVGLVAGILFWLVRAGLSRAGSLPRLVASQRLAAVVALAGTWGFVVFSGAGPPALRAGWMVTGWLTGLILARRTDPWASFGLALVATVLWDPASLAAPGAQLSYVAVGSLLLAGSGGPASVGGATDPGTGARPLGRVGRWLLRLMRATMVATLATAPLTAYHFGQATAAGLALNLVAVPLVCAVVVPLALAGTPFWLFGLPGAGLIASLSAGAAQGLLAAVRLGSESLSPLVTWRGEFGIVPLLGTYGCLAGALILWRSRRPARLNLLAAAGGAAATARRRGAHLAPWKVAGGIMLVLGLSLIALARMGASLGPAGGAGLQVEFLNVGAGDAILVTLPDGSRGLVDAAGPPPGSRSGALLRVRRALARRGVERLAFLAITHEHSDHMGAALSLVDPPPGDPLVVETMWHPDPERGGRPWHRLCRRARARGVLVQSPPARIGGVVIERLGPHHKGEPAAHPLRSENDNSMVLHLRHPAGSLLLAADLEREGIHAVLERARRLGRPLRATVLKVAHHGSRSGSPEKWIAQVRPLVAVVTAADPGLGRAGGGPDSRVLRRLRRAGARVLVTGRDGDVRVTLAPWGIRVQAGSGPAERYGPDTPPWPPCRIHRPWQRPWWRPLRHPGLGSSPARALGGSGPRRF